jgi:hypothetical protein
MFTNDLITFYVHLGIPPHGAHMPPPFPMFPMGFPPVPPPGVPPGAQQHGLGPTPPQPPTTQGPSSTTPQPSSNPVSGTFLFCHNMRSIIVITL